MQPIPTAFRAPALLQRLNVIAVAASLAACTGAALAGISAPSLDDDGFGDHGARSVSTYWLPTGAASALSTFACALVWATLLRSRRGPLVWLLSVPLAALNAGIALALCSPGPIASNMLLGATLGAFIWAPAVFATLVCFGVPIYLARRAAERGLSSEDRGERTVGIVACLLALAGLALSGCASQTVRLDVLAVLVLATLAVATGGTSAVLSHVRERKRRLFVGAVRAGTTAGYRLENKGATEVVVRVTDHGHAYRAASLTEPVLTVDEAGDTTSALVSAGKGH